VGIAGAGKIKEVITIDSAEYIGPFTTLVYGIIILIIIIAGMYVCYYLFTGRRL